MEKSSPFKSLLRFELKSAAIYGGIQVLTRFGGLMALPLFWQKLTPADFGVIALAEVFTAVSNASIGLGFDQSITRLYHDWPETDRKRNVGTVWMAHWLCCLVFGAIGILALSQISRAIFPAVDFHPYLLIAGINSTLLSMTMIAMATMRIRQRPKEFAIYNFTRFALQTGLTLTFVLALNRGLKGYLEGMLVAAVALVGVGVFVMLRNATPAFDKNILRQAARFGLPLVPSQVFSSFSSILDRLIIQYTGSLEATGLYSIALKFAGIPNSAHEVVKSTAAPFIYKSISDGSAEALSALRKMIIFYISPIFAAGIVVMLFMDKVVLFLGDARYYSVIQYIPLLTVACMIPCLNVYCNGGALFSKKTEWTLPPVVVSLVLFAVGCFYLMPRFGVMGLIVAKLAGNLGAFLLAWIISRKLYPAWNLDWISFAAFCGCAILVLAAQQVVHNLSPSVNAAISVMILAGVAAIFLKVLTRLSGLDFRSLLRRKQMAAHS